MFVYVIGAAIEALRVRAAGYPVEQALAVVPKATLAALAVDALFLPALLTGAVIAGVHFYVRNWSDKKIEKASQGEDRENSAKKWPSIRRLWQRLTRVRLLRLIKTILIVLLALIVIAWRYTVALVPYKGWMALIAVILFVPSTPYRFIFLGVIFVQARTIGLVLRRAGSGSISRRREALLMACIASGSVAATTLGREIVHPGPLPLATVTMEGSHGQLLGDFFAATSEDVYIGTNKSFDAIPMRLVERVAVHNGHEQAEKRKALIELLL